MFLSFEGVDKSCRVYLNGAKAGEHQGAYSTFRMDITEALRNGNNLLTVLVNNEKGTDVNPISGDFTLFGGIYRDVKLILTPEIHFDPVWYGTDGVTASGIDWVISEIQLFSQKLTPKEMARRLTEEAGKRNKELYDDDVTVVAACLKRSE